MSIQIDIPCTSVSIEKGTSDKPLLAVCEEARADVVIEQIKDDLGAEYVLNVFSKSEIQQYMHDNGFTVFDDEWKVKNNAKAA